MRNSLYIKITIYLCCAMSIISALAGIAGGAFIGLGMTNIVMASNDPTSDINQMAAILSAVGAFLTAISAAMFFRAVIFINFARKSSIEQLQVNRWALIVLSLGISSFIIPFVLKRTTADNVVSNSEESPARFNLSRWFSLIGFAFGFVGFGTLVLYSSVQIGLGTYSPLALYISADLNTVNLGTILLGVFGGLFGAPAFIALVSLPALFGKAAIERYKSKSGAGYGYQVFLTYIYTIWCTILLVFAIFSALMEILSAFSRAFGRKHENFLSRMIAIISLPIILAMQGYIIFTCSQTIKGIWSKEDAVSFKRYSRVYDIANRGNNNSNVKSLESDTNL